MSINRRIETIATLQADGWSIDDVTERALLSAPSMMLKKDIADVLTRKTGMERYEAVRHLIKTADCVVWQAPWTFDVRYWFGMLIRIMKGDFVNHASFVVHDKNMDRIVEALEDGVVPRRLSRRLEEYKGKAYLLQLRDEFDCVRKGAAKRAEIWAVKDDAYDWLGCATHLITRPPVKPPWHCSELYYAMICQEVESVQDQLCIDIMRVCSQMLRGGAPRPGDLKDLPMFKRGWVRIK